MSNEYINLLCKKIEAIVVASASSKSAELSAKSVEHLNTKKPKQDIIEIIEDLLKNNIKILEIHKQHAKNIKLTLKLIKKERKLILNNTKKTIKGKRNIKSKITLTELNKPSKIKQELCIFLNVPINSLSSRADTFDAISNYIKKNKLKNPDNEMYFIPDETLSNILSPLIQKDTEMGYNYFNIQRYISHLFIKK